MIQELYADHAGVKIHMLETHQEKSDDRLTPLLIVPGLNEDGADYADVIRQLAPRRVAVVTLRGRGKSDAPQSGYRLEDHVGDIEAAVERLGLGAFCLMGFSRGTSYALGYAVRHMEKLQGLIFGDYPAHHTRLVPDWVEWASHGVWLGRDASERMPLYAVQGIQRESAAVEFWPELSRFDFPALVLRGGLQGGLLSEEIAARYLAELPRGEAVVFEQSGHDLRKPDADFYYETLKRFLARLDG